MISYLCEDIEKPLSGNDPGAAFVMNRAEFFVTQENYRKTEMCF
jgi:hypothetical protein